MLVHGTREVSNVLHTLAKWELSFQRFGSKQLPFPDDGGCKLPKHWKDSFKMASVCEMLDMLEIRT